MVIVVVWQLAETAWALTVQRTPSRRQLTAGSPRLLTGLTSSCKVLSILTTHPPIPLTGSCRTSTVYRLRPLLTLVSRTRSWASQPTQASIVNSTRPSIVPITEEEHKPSTAIDVDGWCTTYPVARPGNGYHVLIVVEPCSRRTNRTVPV